MQSAPPWGFVSRLLVLLAATLVSGAALALDPDPPVDGVDGLLPGGEEDPDSGAVSDPPPLKNPLGGKVSVPGLGEMSFAAAITFGGAITLMGAYIAFSIFGTKFVTNQNVLENDARRELYEYIRNNPGTHLRATAAALGLSTTNALWHLRKLEQSNLINSKRLEGYKVFYPVEGGLEAKRIGLAMAVLRNDNAKQILTFISSNPGSHQRAIARALTLNHGTIRWHLRKFEAVGLVTELHKDNTSQYYINELGNMALAKAMNVAIATLPPAPQLILQATPSPESMAEELPASGGVPAGIDTEVEA